MRERVVRVCCVALRCFDPTVLRIRWFFFHVWQRDSGKWRRVRLGADMLQSDKLHFSRTGNSVPRFRRTLWQNGLLLWKFWRMFRFASPFYPLSSPFRLPLPPFVSLPSLCNQQNCTFLGRGVCCRNFRGPPLISSKYFFLRNSLPESYNTPRIPIFTPIPSHNSP